MNNITLADILKLMPAGMLQKGNIDIENRPVIRNKDGSISTLKSFSRGFDDVSILMPSIIDGKENSQEEALAKMLKTRKNLGVFDSPENADSYGRFLSFLSSIGR